MKDANQVVKRATREMMDLTESMGQIAKASEESQPHGHPG